MSESGSLSDEGSSSSSSKFEPAMSGSSWPLLESCTKETLDDPHNCQTLANIGSSSMLVGERVVCDAIPIFRSEFTADHLENNLLDSEKQLEAIRRSCSIPRSVGIRLVRCEELPSKLPKGHVMFYTQTLVTLGWRYCYKMRPVKACAGYAECECRSKRERVVFDKRKAYCTWKKRWCFLYNDWEHANGATLERRVPTYFQTVGLTQGTIKLSRQKLADVEKVLRVPKEDRHLVEKVGKKVETSTKKMRVPMLVPSKDILFHKEARKHRVAASKKAEAEAIGCDAAIVAREDRRLLPPLPTINPIFPPVREHIGQKGDHSSSNDGRRFTFDELGEPLAKDESDCDRMLKLFSYVMAEYHDRLLEAERCKVKLKENKQLVNDARKTSKALAEAIQVKDQHFESLKRRNGENLRLKVQLEATKKQLGTTMLEVSKVKGELDSALVEVSELKSSIPTEKEAAVKEFLVYSSNVDESGDEASADEQSHQGDDEFGDAENGDRTQSDLIRGSTSYEDD
ncbi:unnamed protein product [Malus baccata var. baccata]